MFSPIYIIFMLFFTLQARETADYFSQEFRASMVPLYALREAIQYSGYFDAIRDEIGAVRQLPPMAENVDILGGDATLRNVTNICDQPEALENWSEIVNKITDEHELGGGLIFRWRLWPLNVACLEFKGGKAMMDSGMDANVSPHKFWSNVVLDIFPREWSGLHVFGPFAAKLPVPGGEPGETRAQDVFCTHIPIYTPIDPNNAFKDVVEIEERAPNGTVVKVHKEPNVWGFTMIYLNWSEMKKRSNIYQRFADVSLEFELFKQEPPRLGQVGPKGAPTAEMTKLVSSELGDALNDLNSVEVTTESLHGIWVNR